MFRFAIPVGFALASSFSGSICFSFWFDLLSFPLPRVRFAFLSGSICFSFAFIFFSTVEKAARRRGRAWRLRRQWNRARDGGGAAATATGGGWLLRKWPLCSLHSVSLMDSGRRRSCRAQPRSISRL